jgi:hypothetical protein
MKSVLISVSVFLFADACALGQGTVFFYNHVPAVGLDAPVFDTDGMKLQGGQFQAQLYAGPTADSLVPVGLAASFGSAQPGYWSNWYDPLDRTIPNVPPGQEAYCQVRVWSYLRGASYDQVAAVNGKHGASPVFSVTTGGLLGTDTQPPGFPAYLTGLQSFELVGVDPAPEPATLVLFGISLVVWAIFRFKLL